MRRGLESVDHGREQTHENYPGRVARREFIKGTEMSETVEDIVSEKRCLEVHGNSNFGNAVPRRVLNCAVLSYALGFTTGHTAMTIAQEHGLITKPRGYTASLTKKGKRYVRAMTSEHFNAISGGR